MAVRLPWEQEQGSSILSFPTTTQQTDKAMAIAHETGRWDACGLVVFIQSKVVNLIYRIFIYYEIYKGGLSMDINVRRLRCILGWLAMLLPWLSGFISLIITGHWACSISETYYLYETAAPVFAIILGAASILLIAYKGYETIDDVINTLAGIFGLGILIFPTYATSAMSEHYPLVGTFCIHQNTSAIIHLVCAVVFFGFLSFNSLFLFTKSNGNMTKEKKIRNIIFRVCGVGMLASFALLLIPNWAIKIWAVEALALAFFGISWLTKANCYKWFAADK